MNNNYAGSSLSGKRLLLGVTGGVAAYKAAELARLLTQAGCLVKTVMTDSACRFIGPITFQSLTGQFVFSDLWEADKASAMAHINLSRNVDLILIAPASADFIAKLACGLANDLLTTVCLARNCPLMIAPAMNRKMWENPATQRNISCLQNDGVIIAGPENGEQACGEVGMGRMLAVEALLAVVQQRLSNGLLQGKNVLITAGPTFEAIDAVRGITNISSGKMGYALAQAALDAGATVTLVTGPTCLSAPAVNRLINVSSAREMLGAVETVIAREKPDIFIGVAAVADYRAVNISPRKIKKTDQKLVLELMPNPDILAQVAYLPEPPFCVGFAAETENLEKNAARKRRQKKLPLLVANWAQEAMNSDEAALILLDDDGQHVLERASKQLQAGRLIRHIAKLYLQQQCDRKLNKI
ncbi:phosphopantothenoylcysteine decarboxylase / phosphopantothenate--cysteine ligase [Nitrosomonas sp. Nm51]|uniref:bifunctional phosphopantothenoylcysteine decarboxylase/phosphopantothenate--cysteine ligase CoaBC n=1 Tax=Nitrosomonas sp. Nm51 TaxID=133720 RepID=UPI0008C9FC24|nr:bifunctional phosphopantothenoylcysteine decarboxylase/phosphopantothenate--cysteine ligase CoaBC [Nitrosomonas sp. Nm51]SER32266.1 phosphopantothenoylcysteine decarboxylase / phosphopantothenate--cysteine ligase [Nitrosomonas sp. Nm51]